MTGLPVTPDTIRAARERIGGAVHRTPLVSSATLSRLAGCPVHLKLENFQKTGSFKPRGALNNILQRTAGERDRGIITISAGNHAQGVAWAGRHVGARTVVVMPASASPAKVAAARGYGAEVVLHGDVTAAFAKLEELRRERSLTYIHAFDDEATIAGQGTVGLECVEEIPEVARVVVGVGGGGLISGVALAVKGACPSARVIGVEPEGADAMTRSLRAGAPVRLDAIDTIADGLAPPFVGDRNFAIVKECVDEVVTVDDDAIRRAMRFLLERCKILAEPAGAAATAALIEGRAGASSGPTIVIVSGGNVAPAMLADCLRRAEGDAGS